VALVQVAAFVLISVAYADLQSFANMGQRVSRASIVSCAGFMAYNFAATRHRDSEAHSSSIYGQARLSNPSTSLPDYIDGEPLRNQDVVVWVNSGLYHIPVAEDTPVTTTTGNMLGFSLVPFNWASESPATDMADMISITSENKAVPAVKTAVTRCQPSYLDVKFLQSGWESA
jgi:Cu2+-containing amine oxidase